jgi:HSP20 family protein
MDHIKVILGDPFDRAGSQFEKTIQDFFRPRPVNPMFACKHCSWVPQMDMYETEQDIIIWAELAGIEKENLEVEVNSKAVRIHGFRRETPRSPEGTYRLAEIRYGKFERVLYLPSPVDSASVTSAFSNGLLTIQMKKLEVQKTHKIPISDG